MLPFIFGGKKRRRKKKRNSKQKHERSATYRADFFRHNKGVAGLYFCMYCGKPLLKKWVEVDHIKPIAKGGSNHHSNLGASCRKCNRSKSDKYNLSYAVRGHGGKAMGSVMSVPFAIVGKVFETFFSLSFKFQIVIAILIFFWIRSII